MTAAQVAARDAARSTLAYVVELHRAFLDCSSDYEREHAEEAAREVPLSVEVRADWVTPGQPSTGPAEFRTLMGTGGPASRIVGDLDQWAEPVPESLRVEGQDWGTPWLPIDCGSGAESAALGWFTRLFWYSTD